MGKEEAGITNLAFDEGGFIGGGVQAALLEEFREVLQVRDEHWDRYFVE